MSCYLSAEKNSTPPRAHLTLPSPRNLPTYPPTMSTSSSFSTLTTTAMLLFILTSGIIQPTHATVSNCYTQSNVTVICEFPGKAVDPDCKVSNLACPPTECLVGYTREEWFCDRWQAWGCSFAVCCVFFFSLSLGGSIFAPHFFFTWPLVLIIEWISRGVFSRSRAARTGVMFRNLLPKEVFTKTFSLYMTRNVYLL